MARSTSYIPPSSTMPPPSDVVHETETTGGLLRRLGEDLATLLRKELALATSEISQSVTEARRGVSGIATGGAVLFAGFLILLLAATAALAEVMEAWLAGLIVGGIVAIIGYAMLAAGRKKLSAGSLKPERTQESLRQDSELLRRRTP